MHKCSKALYTGINAENLKKVADLYKRASSALIRPHKLEIRRRVRAEERELAIMRFIQQQLFDTQTVYPSQPLK